MVIRIFRKIYDVVIVRQLRPASEEVQTNGTDFVLTSIAIRR